MPALLLTAAVLLATGTGLGGIGALGQVTGGPSLPPAEAPAAREQARASRASDVALAPTPAAGSTTTTAGGRAGGTPGSSAGTPAGRGNRVRVPGSPVTGTPRTQGTPSPSPTTPGATPPAGSPTAGNGTQGTTAPTTPHVPVVPTTPANPVQQVVDGTKGLGEALPSPLGPTVNRVSDGLQTVAPR